MEDADNAVDMHCQVNEQSNEQSTAMEKRVWVTSNIGPDVVKVSASSRGVGSVSPLVPRPGIGPPFLGQVLYLIMRTSSMYYAACLIAIT